MAVGASLTAAGSTLTRANDHRTDDFASLTGVFAHLTAACASRTPVFAYLTASYAPLSEVFAYLTAVFAHLTVVFAYLTGGSAYRADICASLTAVFAFRTLGCARRMVVSTVDRGACGAVSIPWWPRKELRVDGSGVNASATGADGPQDRPEGTDGGPSPFAQRAGLTLGAA
jgi:hypothetical protein